MHEIGHQCPLERFERIQAKSDCFLLDVFICLCVHVLRNRIHFSSQMNLSEKNIEREMWSHQDTDGSLRSDHGAEEL